MIQGLYAAASGMMAVEDRQAVIANNIANALTPGFKSQVAVETGFYEVFFGETRRISSFNSEKTPGGGIKVTETFTRFSDGPVRTTGNALDIALIGPGFIAVETPNGERFTRSGQLSVNTQGQLVTSHGYVVSGAGGGTIEVSGGQVAIDDKGNVRVNGTVAGQIRIVEFEDRHMLNHEGYSLYRASEQALDRSGPASNTVVASESLEMSNVQLPAEVARMMQALRAYAANQKVITAIDETMSRLIDQVGMPG